VNLAHIDCELPSDDEQSVAENGDTMQGFWHFKMIFSRDIYASVVEIMLSAKAPSYTTVLDLDRKIRQISLPQVKLYLRPDDDGYNDPSLCMKSYMMSHYRSLTMIHIHRTFFAQALLDNPTNPLSSPYAPSFLAANRCASILLKSFIHHHERCGALCGRFWGMWTHAFSASVIIGATVARMPQSSLTPSALVELDLAIGVFEKGASSSVRAQQALPFLLKLKDRANQAYQDYRDRHLNPTAGIQPKIPEEAQTALAIFGGQTRVLPTKSLSRKRRSRPSTDSPKETSSTSSQAPSPSSPATSATPSESGPTPAASDNGPLPLSDFHPSLVMYLSQVPTNSPFQTADFSQILETPTELCSHPSIQPSLQPAPVSQQPPEHMSSGDLDFLTLLSNPEYQQTLPQFQANMGTQLPTDGFEMPDFTGDVVMSDQWVSLMQETGLLDGVENFTQEHGFNQNLFSF